MTKRPAGLAGGLLKLQLGYGIRRSSLDGFSYTSRNPTGVATGFTPAPCLTYFSASLPVYSSFSKGFSAIARLFSESQCKPCSRQLESMISSPKYALLQNYYYSSSSSASLYSGLLSSGSRSLSISPSYIVPRGFIGFPQPSARSLLLRHFSFRTSDSGKFSGNFIRTVIDGPVSAFRSVFWRYREAFGLQIEAFWKRNYPVLLGAGAAVLCAILWRLMFGIASTFVSLSEGMAKYGFLALSAAIVAFTGMYIRSRFTINPDKVYRMAMRKLNTSAGILEVMGAPLSGTDLRAYVLSGGGLTLKNFRPALRGKRCFLIFPIRGSERKGLVSVEVKKKKGQYDMKLLAVDIPMVTGRDQRLFLIGDEDEYRVGGGLISELRDPVVKAMTAAKEFEDLDQMEEEEDAERELMEAERKHLEEIEKLNKDSSH